MFEALNEFYDVSVDSDLAKNSGLTHHYTIYGHVCFAELHFFDSHKIAGRQLYCLEHLAVGPRPDN